MAFETVRMYSMEDPAEFDKLYDKLKALKFKVTQQEPLVMEGPGHPRLLVWFLEDVDGKFTLRLSIKAGSSPPMPYWVKLLELPQ